MMNKVNGMTGSGGQVNGPSGKKQNEREKPLGGVKTAKTDKFEQAGGVRLSEKAQKLLKQLQLKYGDTDFIIADYDSDEEANRLLAGGKKEYSVLIDPETLEQMANDEETRAKYEGMIDQSREQISAVMQELNANGKSAKMVGATVDDNGNMQMFAELEEMTERRNEQIEKSREAAERNAPRRRSKPPRKKRQVSPESPASLTSPANRKSPADPSLLTARSTALRS